MQPTLKYSSSGPRRLQGYDYMYSMPRQCSLFAVLPREHEVDAEVIHMDRRNYGRCFRNAFEQ
jgi:hypothetical protein